jgi:hypothetical protein
MLSQREEEKCLQQVGSNDPSPRERGALLLELLVLFVNLLVMIRFTALPLPFFLFLGISTITDLLLVEAAKRRFFAVSRHQASLAEAPT